jgi:hypothetical protein
MAGARTDLRRILVAYTVNELGSWFGYIALAVAVYDHTHSALAVSGLFVSARFLPALAVPALVARVEASTRRGTLSGLYFVEGVASAALAVLLWHFWLPAVLVLVAIDGTAALTAKALLRAAAARAGATAAVMSRSPIGGEGQAGDVGAREANAALNVAYTTTVVAGPLVAGIVVASFGGSAALFVDAVSFAICGALLLHIRPHVEDLGESVRVRLRTAWQYLRGTPALRTLIVTEAIAIMFFESIQPIEVLYAKATLGAGDRGYGILMAVWGVGMVAGSLVFVRSGRRPLGPMLAGSTLTVGLSYLGLAGAPDLAVAAGVSVVGGIGNGIQWASLLSAVQKMTPPSLHARVMGAMESILAICPVLGFSVGGLITAASSPRGAFLVAGVIATGTTAVFLKLPSRPLQEGATGENYRVAVTDIP